MGLTPATVADLPDLAAFLGARADVNMFALSNLFHYGLGSGPGLRMRFWLVRRAGGIAGALGLSGLGTVFPWLPAPGADWQAAARTVQGLPLAGLTGEAACAGAFLAAANLTAAPAQRDVTEPGFALDLARLVLPPADGARLVVPGPDHRPTLIRWRADYVVEVLGTPPGRAEAAATADIGRALAGGRLRLLLVSGRPAAMTGFNATLPSAVHIGGVYTPPDQRGRGHARLAVALHLAEARAAGVRHAYLYAFSEQAARAYRAIGFAPSGHMRFVTFAQPQEARP